MSTETTNTETTLPPLPPIFAACVAQEPSRYSLEKPWVMGGVVYATDGRILVRMPVPGVADTASPQSAAYPPAETLGWSGPWAMDPVAMPEVAPENKREDCPSCDYGNCVCACCDDLHPCGKCGGSGLQPAKRFRVPLGDGTFGIGDNYARLLAAHGAALFLYTGTTKPEVHPIRFTTPDGAEGLLMPMKAEVPLPTRGAGR